MTTLVAVRRQSANNHRPGDSTARVAVVAKCTVCPQPMNAPGVCTGRTPAEQATGLGHTSTQFTANRAGKRDRWVRGKSGERLSRWRPRAHILASPSRLRALQLAHAADRRRLLALDEAGRARVIAGNVRAEQRRQRRAERPGALRAALFEHAWAVGRAVKAEEAAEARVAANRAADEQVARMQARQGAPRRRMFGRRKDAA